MKDSRPNLSGAKNLPYQRPPRGLINKRHAGSRPSFALSRIMQSMSSRRRHSLSWRGLILAVECMTTLQIQNWAEHSPPRPKHVRLRPLQASLSKACHCACTTRSAGSAARCDVRKEHKPANLASGALNLARAVVDLKPQTPTAHGKLCTEGPRTIG